MKRYMIGDKLKIQCYKHNGKIHRAWDEAVILDVKEDYIVCGNDKTLVTESAGNMWRTKEPAIMYFFKNSWYNIIVQLKKDGVYYYCNIATPYIIEENTIKYIDYDLDLRIFPNGNYKVLDKMEYEYHKTIMNYSEELEKSIQLGLNELINSYQKNYRYFDNYINNEYYKKYNKLVKTSKVTK